MALRWYQVVVDALDPPALARWWAEALGWSVVYEAPDEVVIAPSDDFEPTLCFVPVADPKVVKDRLHIDLAPDDQDAEVARLEGMGARRVDIGQGPRSDEITWVVLADPEGNELCVLTAR